MKTQTKQLEPEREADGKSAKPKRYLWLVDINIECTHKQLLRKLKNAGFTLGDIGDVKKYDVETHQRISGGLENGN